MLLGGQNILHAWIPTFFPAHCTVCSQRALCVGGPCMGVRGVMVLIGDTKQAMSEGKSGPVEIGLTWPVATALLPNSAKRISTGALGNISHHGLETIYYIKRMSCIFESDDESSECCNACLLKIEKTTYKLSWNGQKQIARQVSLHLMIVCILSAVRKVYT